MWGGGTKRYPRCAARRIPSTPTSPRWTTSSPSSDSPRRRPPRRPPKLAPHALDARQQKRYLRAVERRPLARDRAIGRLLFYSGVRIAELVALDDDDVPLSARKGKVIVRSGKGETSRENPAPGWHRADLHHRVAHRPRLLARRRHPGAVLNRRGGRLSTRGVDQLMDQLAPDADILDALEDSRFVDLIKRGAEAAAWEPDDPRIAELATAMADHFVTNPHS